MDGMVVNINEKSGIILNAELDIELRVESLTQLMIELTSLCKASHKQITGRHKIFGRNPLLTSGVDLNFSFSSLFLPFKHVKPICPVPLSPTWSIHPHSPLCELWACISALITTCSSGQLVCPKSPFPANTTCGTNQDSASTEPDCWAGPLGAMVPRAHRVLPGASSGCVKDFPWGVTGQQSQGTLSPTHFNLSTDAFIHFIEMISFEKAWMWEGKVW